MNKLVRRLKFMNGLSRLYLNKKSPLKVNHHITYKCNLKCAFCKRISENIPELNTTQIKDMMGEFKKIGCLYWMFNGGEPLLRNDIGELIQHAKKLNFYCTLISNGVLIPKRIDELKQVDKVLINILGPEKIEDKIKSRGHYKKVVKALNVLSDQNIPTEILTVIFNGNIRHINDLIDLAEKFGAGIRFQLISVHEQDKSGLAKKYFPNNEEFSSLIDWLVVQKKHKKFITSSTEYFKIVKNALLNKHHEKCWAAKAYCNITPQGDIVPCCAKLSSYKPKSLGTINSFKTDFEYLPDMSGCNDCYYSGPLEFNIFLNNIFYPFRRKF